MRLVTIAFALALAGFGAFAASAATSKGHLQTFRSEHSAREHCPGDRIVWANTRAHTLHVSGDAHFRHTHGGFACEAEARRHGYRGPTVHA